MKGPPGRVGPPKKMKLVVFRSLYFRGAPLGHMMGPFEPEIGPVGLKVTLAEPVRALHSM